MSIANPGGLTAGQQVVVLFACAAFSGEPSISSGNNWTLHTYGINVHTMGVITGEVGSVTWPLVISHTSSRDSYVMVIVDDADGAPIVPSSFASSSASQPDPPDFDPGLGEQDYLWIAMGTMQGTVPTGPPSGYSGLATYLDSTATSRPGAFSAYRQATGSDEDPSAFSGATVSGRAWQAATVAVKGISAPTAVQQIAVGSTLLDGVDDIRIGNDVVDRVYVGSTLVYGPA